MVKKLNYILNIVMGGFIGVFIGRGLFVLWECKTHPGLYAMQSAPWYTSIVHYGIFTLVALAILLVIKVILRRKIKQSQIPSGKKNRSAYLEEFNERD